MRPPPWLARHIAALRMLLVLSVLTGLAYPLAVLGAAQLPGLRGPAAGSLVTGPDGEPVGSALLGQPFVDRSGAAIERYFLPRPSAAGPPPGYHATDSGGSNLGPEDVVDRPGRPSLLTQVCRRSLQVGQREGVDGSRPYCTPDGVGAVLAVFRDGGAAGPVTRAVSLNLPCPATPFPREYRGVAVECARPGVDYTAGAITPVRGTAPPVPAVPADAVTAGASGLEAHISPAYARLQAPRVARERGVDLPTVLELVDQYTTGRLLGFVGEPAVNVLQLNLALDRRYPPG
jgi:K+-transporting ATPase ATPase C chain